MEVGVKVLVPIKRVIDPYVKVIVRSDGSGVEQDNVKKTINPFDEIALEEAIRWQEQGKVEEVIAVSIGRQDTQETLRQALALGATKAIHMQTDITLYPLQVASLLKQCVEQQKPDIVIMGKQAIDDDCNQTGQMLAGMLNWPQATFASNIEFKEDNCVEVVREIDGGLESIQLQLPAVITTDLRLNEPRYPSLPNIMKAKRKPLESIVLNDSDIAKVCLNVEKVTEPKARQAGIKVSSVDELIDNLKNKAKVI
jgi:electron transfer flavoprotein beta subunit